MDRKVKWKEKWITSFELPYDLAFQDVMIHISGRRQIIVENYKSIVVYSPELLILALNKGKLHIWGENMQISYYTFAEVKILGNIRNISFSENS